MAGTRFLVHSLLGIFLLAATCSAQEAEAPAPSALAPLEVSVATCGLNYILPARRGL